MRADLIDAILGKSRADRGSVRRGTMAIPNLERTLESA
jgi:hypothetical protein